MTDGADRRELPDMVCAASPRDGSPASLTTADESVFALTRKSLQIRAERAADRDAVRRVHDLAFGGTTEGTLVDRLRGEADPLISLVAVEEGQVVGHVVFSSVRLIQRDQERPGMGLGPMAVVPSHQRRGIGTRVVERGLEVCRQRAVPFVVVVGHPEYYPRFGFVPASKRDVGCEFDVPDEVFMVLELSPGGLSGGGLVRYHPAFSELDSESGA